MAEMEDESAVVVAPSSFVEAQTRGEIDTQIRTAKAFPRSIDLFKKELLGLATSDQETAEECFYALPRGGKTIEGPGVRFSEMVASSWEHLRVQTMIVNVDDTFVTARGVAWDMQKNNAASCDVMRRITDSKGRRYNDDMIVVTSNAAMAIARRNAIFAVVPKSYWIGAFEKAREVAIGNAQTLADRRSRALEAFQKMGVTPQKIFDKLGIHGEEDITLEHLGELTGLRTAIKEGTTSVDEAFPVKPEPAAAAATFKKSENAKKDDPQPNTGGSIPPAQTDEPSGAGKSEASGATPEGGGKPPEETKKGAKGGKAKDAPKDPIKEKMDQLREFVEGPIEVIRDTAHADFLELCKGLKGDEFNKLLLKYNERKKEL